MENIMNNPVIGVVMCRNRLKGHATQTLQEKYLNAIIHAGGLPIALPHALAVLIHEKYEKNREDIGLFGI